MDISKTISIDILKYLQEKKGLSVDDIAKAMSVTPIYIQEIIDKKSILQVENVNSYLKNQDIKFWEFVLEAIPMDHISSKTKKKIQICKELSEHLNKVKKKS